MKKNLKIKLIVLFIFVFLFSHNAYAAVLDFHLDKNQIKTGDIFNLTLLLNTQGEYINTIEGDLKYDENFLKIEVVNTSSSFVNFWVEKPDIKTPGSIHFSGITPGGISTTNGEVFRVILRAKQAGDTNLLLSNVNLFLNDGKGSLASTKITNANIQIVQGNGIVETPDVIHSDKIPPEKFSIMRSQDPFLFDNNYFIVFSAIDKESGVDHYEVCELFKCVSGESPFLLWNQTPFYHITVKAYDMNGNLTTSTLISPWLILLLFLLFIAILYLCFYLRKNLARK